jgi:hypothetical protein
MFRIVDASLPALLKCGSMAACSATRAIVRSRAAAGGVACAAPSAKAMARAGLQDSLIMVVFPFYAASHSARLTRCRRSAYQSYSV